jgi:type I restriction enzyme S subunit
MGDEWPRIRLGDCGAWSSGGTPSTRVPNFWGGDLPWVTSKDVYVRYLEGAEQTLTALGAANGTRIVGPNAILIVVRSMALANGVMIALTRRPVAFNQDIKAIVPVDRVCPRFLLFSLWGHETQLRDLIDEASHGTKRLRTELLQDFEIPLPPPEEQRAIADVVGALDDKIEGNRRLADAADATWLSHCGHHLRHVRTMPVQELLMADVLTINDGYRAKNSELSDDGIAFVRAGNLTDKGLDLTGADRIPPDLAARVGTKRSVMWDTAFTSKGTVGRITLVGPDADTFVYSPQVCFWRSLDPERLSPFVLHAWMRSTRFIAQIDAVKGQTDMADYVSLRDQRAMRFDLPEPAVQRHVATFAEPLARQAAAARKEARTLTAIRNALLPKLASGQIRVPLSDEVEEQLGETIEAVA